MEYINWLMELMEQLFKIYVVYLKYTLCINAALVILVIRFGIAKYKPDKPGHVSAQVLVLGDIGRSPRMQYHAHSIARHGGRVQLVGYKESALLPALNQNGNVQVCPLVPLSPHLTKSLPFIIAGPLKVLWQVFDLLNVLLFKTQPAKWLIVQNPPSIPTLLVAIFVCWARNTRLMIDWHNYGWTILAGTRGSRHPFVRISKSYECMLGRFGVANLTVTHAMKKQLQRAPYNVRSRIVAMHDRPAAIFQPLDDQNLRRSYLQGINDTADAVDDIISGKRRLLVSSTSWTPDEDFSLLLTALVEYAKDVTRVPLLVIITGNGPQKEMYMARISLLTAGGRLRNVAIRTAFLPFEDYARLLACADLGICLHMSSSGVDLPMKVVDMFGSGLPVLAYSGYPSFGELVKVGVNGDGFEKPRELFEGLLRLFNSETGGAELAELKEGAVKEGALRWDDEWDKVVKPILGFT